MLVSFKFGAQQLLANRAVKDRVRKVEDDAWLKVDAFLGASRLHRITWPTGKRVLGTQLIRWPPVSNWSTVLFLSVYLIAAVAAVSLFLAMPLDTYIHELIHFL